MKAQEGGHEHGNEGEHDAKPRSRAARPSVAREQPESNKLARQCNTGPVALGEQRIDV